MNGNVVVFLVIVGFDFGLFLMGVIEFCEVVGIVVECEVVFVCDVEGMLCCVFLFWRGLSSCGVLGV